MAIEDAYYRFLSKWTNDPRWLLIGQTKSILQCHAQRLAAWAALEALQWNNNKGVIFEKKLNQKIITVN